MSCLLLSRFPVHRLIYTASGNGYISNSRVDCFADASDPPEDPPALPRYTCASEDLQGMVNGDSRAQDAMAVIPSYLNLTRKHQVVSRTERTCSPARSFANRSERGRMTSNDEGERNGYERMMAKAARGFLFTPFACYSRLSRTGGRDAAMRRARSRWGMLS